MMRSRLSQIRFAGILGMGIVKLQVVKARLRTIQNAETVVTLLHRQIWIESSIDDGRVREKFGNGGNIGQRILRWESKIRSVVPTPIRIARFLVLMRIPKLPGFSPDVTLVDFRLRNECLVLDDEWHLVRRNDVILD